MCVCVCVCVYITSLYSLPLLPLPPRSPPSLISLPMSTVEGSSEKRVLTLPPYSPTVGVHSVRQLHVGASRLSRVFVSDASGEGITCSCVAPCTLCTACALGYGCMGLLPLKTKK